MPMMRFTQDHHGHKAGDVIEASAEFAANLMEHGVAVNASEPVVERAVVQPEKRTAAVKK